MANKKASPSGPGTSGEAPQVKWDDSNLATSYANVCNVSSTREEVVLLFGLNQSWQSGADLTVQLRDRIILSPHAAKRLGLLLKGVVDEYERRFGTLEVGQRSPASAPGSNGGDGPVAGQSVLS